jgi:hypothetical protein
MLMLAVDVDVDVDVGDDVGDVELSSCLLMFV